MLFTNDYFHLHYGVLKKYCFGRCQNGKVLYLWKGRCFRTERLPLSPQDQQMLEAEYPQG